MYFEHGPWQNATTNCPCTSKQMVVEECTPPKCKFRPVSVDERAVITIKSNPSTGFFWKLKCSNDLVTIEDEGYHSRENRVGAPGLQTFQFLPLREGTATLVFVKERPWSGEIAEFLLVEIPITGRTLT